MTNNFEQQAIEAAKKLIEILKEQIASDIPEPARTRKQELIDRIRDLYEFEE